MKPMNSEQLKREMENIRKAIELNYTIACGSGYVEKPLAWALYQVWKKYDAKDETKSEPQKKIEPLIDNARGTYLEAKERNDDIAEYWHGVLRGLLDAFYVVGERDEKQQSD